LYYLSSFAIVLESSPLTIGVPASLLVYFNFRVLSRGNMLLDLILEGVEVPEVAYFGFLGPVVPVVSGSDTGVVLVCKGMLLPMAVGGFHSHYPRVVQKVFLVAGIGKSLRPKLILLLLLPKDVVTLLAWPPVALLSSVFST
jgi:hypothetical protein